MMWGMRDTGFSLRGMIVDMWDDGIHRMGCLWDAGLCVMLGGLQDVCICVMMQRWNGKVRWHTVLCLWRGMRTHCITLFRQNMGFSVVLEVWWHMRLRCVVIRCCTSVLSCCLMMTAHCSRALWCLVLVSEDIAIIFLENMMLMPVVSMDFLSMGMHMVLVLLMPAQNVVQVGWIVAHAPGSRAPNHAMF